MSSKMLRAYINKTGLDRDAGVYDLVFRQIH
jgi:hypothetical protein